MISFKPLSTTERDKLGVALRRNAEENVAILNSGNDTSFLGCADDTAVGDEEVIFAIRSVPCHY